jgi:hypothetical protein
VLVVEVAAGVQHDNDTSRIEATAGDTPALPPQR